jgi:hypothetical protein
MATAVGATPLQLAVSNAASPVGVDALRLGSAVKLVTWPDAKQVAMTALACSVFHLRALRQSGSSLATTWAARTTHRLLGVPTIENPPVRRRGMVITCGHRWRR